MKLKDRNIRIPLFWKFAVILTLIILLFGSVNIHLLWNSVYSSFEKEIDKRCTVLAKIVAEKSLTPLVYEDNVSLYKILDEIKQSDPSISYAFIINNSNEIVAHTYDINIPENLINANSPKNGESNIQVIQTNNYDYPVIRDIAYPILNGDVGVVRLGIVEDQIQDEIFEVTYSLVLMISAFFVFGLLGALFFSHIITSPIKKISQKLQLIDLKNIENEDFSIAERKRISLFNVKIIDEMDILVGKLTDMIERLKRNRIDLKESQASLIQADKLAALGTLSAGVAHEVNNPISGIKNCINRINKNPENIEQNAKYIWLINEAISKIEHIMSHLLTYSRKQNIKFGELEINNLIENIIDLTNHKLKKNNIKITFTKTNKHRVIASSNHLEQVFVNLILNSSDSIIERRKNETGLKGEIIIRIDSISDKININIIDNGNGISDKLKGRIFDPFFTSKTDGMGTGLGLSISNNLIKEHKGKITFTSTKNLGTKFVVELPISTKKKLE